MRQTRERGPRGAARAWRAGSALLAAGILLHATHGEAGVFGLPTDLNSNGTTSSTSQDPPGWFYVDGTGFSNAAGGDAVHQIKFFIEVTGTTLDIRVFDAGTSGARDLGGSSTSTTFALRDPDGNVLRSSTVGDDNSTTDNRLARFSSSGGGFPAANGGQVFSGLSPGLYEFRVTTSGGTETNAFGLEVRDGSGTHYNVYTIAASDSSLGSAGGSETSFLVGALDSGGSPNANYTEPLLFYSYVDRGCAVQTSNFDMDADNSAGSGSSATLTDVFGAATGLTMSDGTRHEEDTVVVETTTATNLESTNYGMYRVDNDLGSQQNTIDWRVADFTGWSNNPTSLPRNPASPIRIYLPNDYSISGGTVTPAAPAAPVLGSSARIVSGANPPVAGQVTRFAITASVHNPTAATLADAQITIGQPAGVTYVSGSQAGYVDGATTACTGGSGSGFRRCTFASLAPGSVASLQIEVDFSPSVSGLQALTGAPAAGSPPPNTTVWAQYTPAFSSADFPRTEVLGPVCQLSVDVGGTALPTRATLRGLRIDPAGLVEFATGTQHQTLSFDLYGVGDPGGRGTRVRLNPEPIPAIQADSLAPLVYRVATAPIRSSHILVEEIDARGRRHLMGPFAVSDARLRAAFERVEARLERGAGTPGPRRRQAYRSEPKRRAARAPSLSGARPGQGVKIEVLGPGRVEVPFADLGAAGMPTRVSLRRLRVTSQGRDVPFQVIETAAGPEAIAFDAEGLSTDYTVRNVYVVTWAGRRPRSAVALTRSGDPEWPGFVRVEKSRIYVPNAPPEADPWVWDLLFGDGSSWPYEWDPGSGEFDLPGLAEGSTDDVVVRIRLVGRTAHRHQVEAWINGVPVGSLEFDGAVTALLEGTVPAPALLSSGNRLGLRYLTSPEDSGLVYLGQVDLAVPIEPARVPAPLGTIEPYEPDLSWAGADYLIVTHPLFRAAAERIAAYKERDGHRVAVVDVERAYDRYSAGITEANAVAALIREARRKGRLEHVLLVGDDSLDPRDFSGLDIPSFVPSLWGWDGEFGRVPSENRYADVDGDGSPDVAIGRLPVSTAEEAAALAEKIGRQQASLRSLSTRHLFAVDNQAPGDVSFRGAAEAVLPLLPPGSSVSWADVGAGADAARQALRTALEQGAAVTHFFGHGAPWQWTDEGLLGADEVPTLSGSVQDTVLLTWSCESQYFPYLFGDSVNEALLLRPEGGALAAFGGAGITDPTLQAGLYRRLYGALWAPGVSLGEAVRRAKAAALAADPRTRPVIEGFNLLGDPALVLGDPGLVPRDTAPRGERRQPVERRRGAGSEPPR